MHNNSIKFLHPEGGVRELKALGSGLSAPGAMWFRGPIMHGKTSIKLEVARAARPALFGLAKIAVSRAYRPRGHLSPFPFRATATITRRKPVQAYVLHVRRRV